MRLAARCRQNFAPARSPLTPGSLPPNSCFNQIGEIGFVFVEQRIQIHGDEIRRAVVKTVRRVVAGFADGAVVLEKLVERHAVRLQVRIFAAIQILVQKTIRRQRQVRIFRFHLREPRLHLFVVMAGLHFRAGAVAAVVVAAQFVWPDFHQPVLAEPDVLIFGHRGFQRGRQPVLSAAPDS